MTALGYLGQLAVRSPRELAATAHSLGATVLDFQFEDRSPIPFFPPSLLTVLERHDIVLPGRPSVMPGNQSNEGLIRLVALARSLAAETVFEIGTYNGLTTLALAANLPDAVVHTLDLPPDLEPALALQRWDHISLRAATTRVYEGRPEESRITEHYGDSAVFDFSPFYNLCDLVYVDGSHSVEYVRADTETAFKLVSPNGAIVWDDYWRQIPEVSMVLDGMRDERLYRLPGSRLVVWLSEGASARLRATERPRA